MTEPAGDRPLMAPIKVMRTAAASFLVLPLLLGGVVFVAVPGGDYPPPFLPIVLGAVAVGGVLLAETVGYAARPIVVGTPADVAAAASLREYRGRWLVRSLCTELVLLVGLVLAFMLASRWPYVVALVLGWPIMAYELWPAGRLTAKLNLRLEYAGGSSYLDDALHGRRPGSGLIGGSPG